VKCRSAHFLPKCLLLTNFAPKYAQITIMNNKAIRRTQCLESWSEIRERLSNLSVQNFENFALLNMRIGLKSVLNENRNIWLHPKTAGFFQNFPPPKTTGLFQIFERQRKRERKNKQTKTYYSTSSLVSIITFERKFLRIARIMCTLHRIMEVFGNSYLIKLLKPCSQST